MIGRVGDDVAGRDYLAAMAERGVDVTGVAVEASCPTGRAVVLLDRQGENCIVVIAGANGEVDLADIARFEPVAGDVVLLQLEVPTEVVTAAVARATAAGATVVLNLSPYKRLEPDLLRECGVIMVNEHEAALLAALGLELESVVVTRGAAGCTWGGEHATSAAPEVVDTTGAGDAFAGAFAAALARGDDRPAVLRTAVEAGAAAVGWMGAQGWTF
jgi:ribokinase